MIIKFSLSGGSWITGDKVDQIFMDVIAAKFSASVMSALWLGGKDRGSIEFSLQQISARFKLDYLSDNEFLDIQKTMVADGNYGQDAIREIYSRMLEIRDTVKDEDELEEESND